MFRAVENESLRHEIRAAIFFDAHLPAERDGIGGLLAVGANLESAMAQARELRIAKAKVTPSVCQLCSVSCVTLVHTIAGQIVRSTATRAARTTKAP